jgi:hypothetical protein
MGVIATRAGRVPRRSACGASSDLLEMRSEQANNSVSQSDGVHTNEFLDLILS